jgi:hypothetical protein
MNHNRNLPLLPLAALLLSACAGSPSPDPIAGARSFAGSGAAPVAQAVAAPSPPSPEIAEEVGREIPALRGVPGDDQLRTLRWMLRVPDERRLAGLFEDLQGRPGESLNGNAAEARQRVEALISRLEAAGHRADEPEMDRDLADVEANAPPPNYFPPTLIEELARHPEDPEAAKALEEARRVSPRGVDPPE